MESTVSLSKYLFLLVVLIVFGNCYIDFGSHAQFIPDDEVQNLENIFLNLNIEWVVSRTSFSNGSQSLNLNFGAIFAGFSCDCSFNSGTVCHVTDIILSGLKLNGVLPAEFGHLPYLQHMDLSSNNFSGSIPDTFSNLKNLQDLYLYNNQLRGSLPDSLGNLSNLFVMYLNNNQLRGSLPDSLGNLSNLFVMDLSSNNFSGSIPDTFSNLKNLQFLDLSNNQLGGSLPDSLGNLSSLQTMDLSSNNFSGSIPDTFSNLKNLQFLDLSNNQLGGSLPDSLGNLSSLQKMSLDNNQLGGSLPDSLGNLSSLQIMVLSSNNFWGSIPETFGNLNNLIELNMQGTEMKGPFPDNISLLTNLTTLKISDLSGASMAFPNLQDLKQLEVLVLRNCLLTGTIPEYIGNMTDMQILDLSFNKLTGKIPDAIKNLPSLKYMFLTNNSLNGSVPSWLVHSKKNFDVSFNNFTGSTTANCQQANVSLVSSFPLTTSNVSSWCLMKDLPCPIKPEYHSLFINCGGEAMSYDGNDYEEDLNPLGPSYFAFFDSTKWAYSSMRVFSQYDDNVNFIASNTYNLNVTGIYETARLSPLSLRYYGLCLRKESYRVQLHFAEIMYSNDQSSIGRRIFDIYIQGNLVLKDFNIMEKAGGVGKGITMNFSDILVNSSTLEISLYWAGKGTSVLERGENGPLISAITITPTFPIADSSTHTRFSIGAVVGIVIASCVILASLLLFLWMKGYLGRKSKGDEAFQGLDTSYFSLRQIKAATDDFSPINKIGEGGFGPVYKGVLADGKMIAIKQLSSKSRQGNREFVNEIGLISALQHPNLVKLCGCCIEGKELLLIYEYMENNSLARALFGRELSRLNLDWPTRKRICLGIARGLAYLHEESRLKIVHRDIKATNILLDKDLNAKISDFGLAKLDEDENTHISTRIAGTVGYMAPEYAIRGYLTDKADVYSFGVVVLEIVSGKSNTNYKPKGEFVYLLDWAYVLQEQGNLLELMDPSLGSNFPKDEALRLLNLALLCANPSPTLRPIMSSVVSMIKGQIQVQAPIINQIGMQNDNIQFRASERLSQKSKSIGSTTSEHSQIQKSISVDGSLMNLSMSNHSKNEEVQDGSPSSKLLAEIELFDVNLD